MAIIGTFNNVSIIAMPEYPGFKQIDLEMNDTVASSVSQWTGSTQMQWYANDSWSGTITLPSMNNRGVSAWEGFMAELRGMLNVFPVGHPLKRHPAGRAKGVPVVNGAYAAMASTLNTKGWDANVVRQLLPGDHLQIGQRLHRVCSVVNSDASGNASITIWPILRESLTDGTPIILNNPKGLFRLAENKRTFTTTENRITTLTYKIVEAK